MTKKNKQNHKKNKNPNNLYQRAGIWWIRYNADGKKIRLSLGTKNLREAKQIRDELLAKRSVRARLGLEAPKPIEPTKTFGQIAEMWIESRRADDSLAPTTRRQTESIVRRIFIPEFGSKRMDAISVEDIERVLAKLRAKYRRDTVKCQFACLRSIVRTAIRRGWYGGRNPLDLLDRPPTAGPGRDVILTEDEARRFLHQLSGRLYFKVALAMYTGLRWGEIHGLAWANLALDNKPPTLTVERSYRGKPKNEASAATIPISKEAASLLRVWKLEQRAENPWVFPGRYGDCLTQCSFTEVRAIRRATKRAGIDKNVTPHVFRHSFGTWVYERTGDPKLVQRLMRHASFQTSMRYVHDHRTLAPVVDKLPNLTPNPHLRVIC